MKNLKDLSTASYPESTKNVLGDMEVLCSLLMQQKMASSKDEVTTQLRVEAQLGARNYKDKASVGLEGVWRTLTVVLETGAVPNLLIESYLP